MTQPSNADLASEPQNHLPTPASPAPAPMRTERSALWFRFCETHYGPHLVRVVAEMFIAEPNPTGTPYEVHMLRAEDLSNPARIQQTREHLARVLTRIIQDALATGVYRVDEEVRPLRGILVTTGPPIFHGRPIPGAVPGSAPIPAPEAPK